MGWLGLLLLWYIGWMIWNLAESVDKLNKTLKEKL